MTEPAFTIDVHNRLGEGPVWDDRLGRLWWTDILAQRLYHWDWDSKQADYVDLPERLGCLGLTTDTSKLVCAFESGFAIFEPASGAIEWLARPEYPNRGARFNDGRVDRAGRLFAGTMVEDKQAEGAPASGSVFRLDPDGSASELFDGVGVANGICFSPDNATMYFADSPEKTVWDFTLAEDGSVSNRSVFVEGTTGNPDGSDVDAAGHMWNAEWDASRVTAYAPDGSVSTVLETPVTRPTCVTFGGPDMHHLFVTTCSEALPDDVLAAEPHTGKVLVYEVEAGGLPAGRFPLDRLGGKAG